jgi:hypothetical protein
MDFKEFLLTGRSAYLQTQFTDLDPPGPGDIIQEGLIATIG